MVLPGISSISSVPGLASPSRIIPKGAPGEFQKVLESAIQTVENHRHSADTAVQQFLTGEGEDLHKVILSTQRAELSFELFQQVRNKAVQAYQEIMRMQL